MKQLKQNCDTADIAAKHMETKIDTANVRTELEVRFMSNPSKPNFEGEPKISDMLADPIVRLLIARDGWTPDGVRAAMAAASRSLRNARG